LIHQEESVFLLQSFTKLLFPDRGISTLKEAIVAPGTLRLGRPVKLRILSWRTLSEHTGAHRLIGAAEISSPGAHPQHAAVLIDTSS
jgi:hypothetical protein